MSENEKIWSEKFIVFLKGEENISSGYVIEADNFFQAAIDFAQEYDSNSDYCIADGGVIEIVIKDERKGIRKLFKLTAETDIHYYAEDLEA